MEPIRVETTVGKGGVLVIPQLKEGETVEVIVQRKGRLAKPRFSGGWAKGKIHMQPGFDDPIPGMEEYM